MNYGVRMQSYREDNLRKGFYLPGILSQNRIRTLSAMNGGMDAASNLIRATQLAASIHLPLNNMRSSLFLSGLRPKLIFEKSNHVITPLVTCQGWLPGKTDGLIHPLE